MFPAEDETATGGKSDERKENFQSNNTSRLAMSNVDEVKVLHDICKHDYGQERRKGVVIASMKRERLVALLKRVLSLQKKLSQEELEWSLERQQ